jgi:DNA-binding NarL/FixJ family response regulator
MTGTSGAKVLCIDDNPDVAEAMAIELRRAGHVCVGKLEDARDLLGAIERHSPDVVLLDLDMPGPDPLDALAVVARLHPRVRVLVVSGHVRRDLIERALEVGAWGYLSKTDETLSVAAAIAEVLSGHIVLGADARQILRE